MSDITKRKIEAIETNRKVLHDISHKIYGIVNEEDEINSVILAAMDNKGECYSIKIPLYIYTNLMPIIENSYDQMVSIIKIEEEN